MENIEHTKKAVGFLEGTKDNSSFTPLAKPSFSSVKKKWIERCSCGEYGRLSQELGTLKSNGLNITRFFEKEGQSLLEWALIGSEDIALFSFICSEVPKDAIWKAIESDNYYILDVFLMHEVGMEMRNIVTDEKLQSRINKVDILLKTCPDLKEFLNARVEKISNEVVKNNIKLSINPENSRLVAVQ